jgi:hypothetical protein
MQKPAPKKMTMLKHNHSCPYILPARQTPLPDQSPRLGDRLKPELVAVFVATPLVQPWHEVLALAYVETSELVTTLHHNFDSITSYSHTATHRKFS